MVKTITPAELKTLIESKQDLTILDVREKWEVEICTIPGSINVPLTQLAQSLHMISTTDPIVTVCHHGVRSKRAADVLEQNSIKNVASLEGGIDLWSLEIDSNVPRY